MILMYISIKQNDSVDGSINKLNFLKSSRIELFNKI